MFVLPSPHVETAAANAAATPGRVHLEFVHNGTRTVVTRAYATSPLRLLTPVNHGPGAWVYTSTFGGGFVDGDDMTLNVNVRPGATAVLATQASTKIYRSPRGTCMQLNAYVDDGVLFVLPDPVVPFAGARYRQEQRFSVSPGGSLLVVDAWSAGRCASGERWRFLEYSSLLKITVDDRLLVHDSLALRAADGDMPRRFGRFNALATVAIVGPVFRADTERLLMWSAGQHAAVRADQLVTVAPLSDKGCLVRIIGASAEKVGQTVRALLDFVPPLLGDNLWSRKG
jgi:urease accessory protein